jgi:group I intron endonuclease
MIGIYRIKNLINGKCYYGSSKNVENRWRMHKRELINRKHINKILQNAWDKYGEENFVFEFIEECSENQLFEIEQKYLDTNPEYNIGLKSSGGDNISKNPNKNLIVEKIKKGLEQRFLSLTDEEKKTLFSKPLEQNPNWKGGISFIYCECGKRIGYGRTHCIKCTPRSNKNNPFYGKQHSEETKKKLSESKKGKYYGNQNKPIVIDGIEYESYGTASKKLNIPLVTIRWRVLSKNPIYKNYHFKGEVKEVYSKEEQSERHSASQRGKQTQFNKPFMINGVEYRTLKDASEKLVIHPMTIKGRLKSDKFGNYQYIS